MKAMLGIPLYHYLYLKLAKMLFLLLSHVFSPTKSEKERAEQVLPGNRWWGRGGSSMYTHEEM
jgi:hypothetical protein